MTTRQPSHRPHNPAFTLLELLVVVAIIALLIGILLPVLGIVRDSARKAAATALANDVVTASASFQIDNRRLPGYFQQEELGAVTNGGPNGAGFTNSENVLLDLAGGIVCEDAASSSCTAPQPSPDPGNPGFNVVEVDLGVAGVPAILVDNSRIGTDAGGRGYLKLKPEAMRHTIGQVLASQPNGRPNADPDPDPTIEKIDSVIDLIDPFGQPLLIWTKNELAGSNPRNFALEASTPSGSGTPDPANLAWFYWNANAGYLRSWRLGEGPDRTRQAQDPNGGPAGLSLLGSDNDDEDRELSLEGILGSTAFPVPATRPGSSAGDLRPGQARGGVIVVSAGPDRVYFARKQEPSGGGQTGRVDFAPRPSGASQGDVTQNEASKFDDVVLSGGN